MDQAPLELFSSDDAVGAGAATAVGDATAAPLAGVLGALGASPLMVVLKAMRVWGKRNSGGWAGCWCVAASGKPACGFVRLCQGIRLYRGSMTCCRVFRCSHRPSLRACCRR